MSGGRLKKTGRFLKWVRFKIGDLFFPLVEPLLRVRENWNPGVKKHLHQALLSLDENKSAVALLNLNMVLSIKPNHFLARVYRGRIYLKDNRYRLASADYVEANKISQYRFLHYKLSGEYFVAVEKEFGELGASIVRNYDQIFEGLRFSQSDPTEKRENEDNREIFEPLPDYDDPEAERFLKENFSFDEDEGEKFREMGPITKREIEKTDWDRLIKELTS